jgi:hypothetical protein
MPFLSTSKPVVARRGFEASDPYHLRSNPAPSSSLTSFCPSHMTPFGEAGAPATVPATVRVLRGSGTVDTINVTVEVGRKWFHFLHVDDQAASVEVHPPTGFRPQVTALVEYATP